MIYIFLITLLFLLLIDVWTPFLIRKTTVFGISIPEPFIEDEYLHSLKKSYAKTVLFIQLPFIVITSFLLLGKSEAIQGLIYTGEIFLYLIISFVVYMRMHIAVKNYKQEQGWEEVIEVVHVTQFETKFQKQRFPHFLFVPQLIIPAMLFVLLIREYPNMPEIIPTHWGLDGTPDAWSNKSIFTVFMIPLLILFMQALFYGIGYGIFNSSIQVRAQASDLSLRREIEIRKINTYSLAAIGLGTTIFMAFLELETMVQLDEPSILPVWLLGPIFLVFIFGVIFYMARLTKQANDLLKEEGTLESQKSDDANWKLGIFYFDKNNSDVFVEKKFGIGWTVNFARPATWIFLFLIIVLPLIPMFFL